VATLVGERAFGIALGYENLIDQDQPRRDPVLGAVLDQPERRFADFPWSTRDSWSRSRRVVAKAERMPGCGEQSANPSFVITSLDAGEIDARTLYERVYCARGDMGNRIKECPLDLFADIRPTPRSLPRGVGPLERGDQVERALLDRSCP